MDREILFRGQTRKKGEKVRLDGSPIDSNWVYGGIFPNNKGGDFAIIYQQEPTIEKFTVYADTVGQYTGKNDKNGTKIFEGDILVIHNNYRNPLLIEFTEFGWCCVIPNDDKYKHFRHPIDNNNTKYEVIGNIHDNPELLRSEQQ